MVLLLSVDVPVFIRLYHTVFYPATKKSEYNSYNPGSTLISVFFVFITDR